MFNPIKWLMQRYKAEPQANNDRPVPVLVYGKRVVVRSPLKSIIASGADQGTINKAKRLARQGRGKELRELAESIANK